jgi:sirohydrochlorin ferrochelatase
VNTPDPREVALVACAHGTNDVEGQKAVDQLRARIAGLLPDVDVLEASVDVQEPSLEDVVTRLAGAGRRCVVVPLLLSAGYHVFHDIAEVVAASGGLARASGALGPDDALVALLDRRLAEAGVPAGEPVVLGAAGSSDPRAVRDVHRVAADLSARRETAVLPAFLSASEPRIDRVVGNGMAVATYLLAPGYFFDRLVSLRDLGAGPVTAPLAPDDSVARIAVRRYLDTLAAWKA